MYSLTWCLEARCSLPSHRLLKLQAKHLKSDAGCSEAAQCNCLSGLRRSPGLCAGLCQGGDNVLLRHPHPVASPVHSKSGNKELIQLLQGLGLEGQGWPTSLPGSGALWPSLVAGKDDAETWDKNKCLFLSGGSGGGLPEGSGRTVSIFPRGRHNNVAFSEVPGDYYWSAGRPPSPLPEQDSLD